MSDDRDRPDDAGLGEELDVFTGDPVDALFEVELSGEADDDESEPSEAGHGDIGEYAVDDRIGEVLPPELMAPLPETHRERPEVDLAGDDTLEGDPAGGSVSPGVPGDPAEGEISLEDLQSFDDVPVGDDDPYAELAGLADEEDDLDLADDGHSAQTAPGAPASPDGPASPEAGSPEAPSPETQAGEDDDRYAWLYDESVAPPAALADRYAPHSDEPSGSRPPTAPPDSAASTAPDDPTPTPAAPETGSESPRPDDPPVESTPGHATPDPVPDDPAPWYQRSGAGGSPDDETVADGARIDQPDLGLPDGGDAAFDDADLDDAALDLPDLDDPDLDHAELDDAGVAAAGDLGAGPADDLGDEIPADWGLGVETGDLDAMDELDASAEQPEVSPGDQPPEPRSLDDPGTDEELLRWGDDDEPAPPATDWEDFTGEHYVGSSTQEYLGLAEELTKVGEPSEQMAVAAGIPGIETSLVGLEDVVGDDHVDETRADTRPDLGLRLLTGFGLLVLFLVSLMWSTAVAVLATIVLLLAAGEFYAVLIANRRHPVAAFGLAGVAGCLIGTWLWGLAAVPVSLVATLVAVGLYIGTSTPRPSPLSDAALTVLVVAWIGGLGAFAFPIITAPEYRWLIAAVVVIVAALDIGQYFVGRRFGKRPLAPVVSPKKTVEGLIGGAVVALLVAVAFGVLGSPFSVTATVVLALAAIVLGPLGDLSVSLLKRILGVKDMGTVLPGHGGILDRIDALLFVLPAAWVVFSATGMIT